MPGKKMLGMFLPVISAQLLLLLFATSLQQIPNQHGSTILHIAICAPTTYDQSSNITTEARKYEASPKW